jgi:signal transduction histidine kinase
VPDGWGGWQRQESRSVRIPQDAARDFAVASRMLADGHLLQVARSTDSRSVLLAPLRRVFLEVGLAALVLSALAGSVLAWRATRPLRAVAATTRDILATGDLGARVPAPAGSGELAVLVRQLNTLLARNAAHVQVLRETLDNIAHDLRTPLTRLRGTAELALLGGSDPAEARGALADCVEESDRTLHLLEALLDVSAAEAGALKLNLDRIDIRTSVDRAIDLYKEVAEERKITITADEPDPVEAAADPVRYGQAVSNVIDNALKYTPVGGRVEIATRLVDGQAVLTVADSGPGVPREEREAIWRRLYRSDASRSERGYGLGLSLVKAIVEAHKGSAEVGESASGGALFTLRIPAA